MGLAARPSGLTMGPSTWWGRLAIAFTAGFIASMAVFFGAAISGQTGGQTFTDNLWLFIPGLSGMVCLVLSLLSGLIGVIARKERSILVFAAIAIGAMVSFFLVGEFAIPPYD